MLIKNILVWDPSTSQYICKDIDVNLHSSTKENNANEFDDIRDAQGKFTLLPGLLDAHVHGFGGADFADIAENPESLKTILNALGETGLSYVMATFVSLPIPQLTKALKVINDYFQEQTLKPTPGAARLVGVHLEGPFIDKECKGAHNITVLQDKISVEQFQEIINSAPLIKEWKITLAPDLPGAIDFIKSISTFQQQGVSVKVFLGHTNPQKSFIDEAVDAGIAGFTHLGNGCMESTCRLPHTENKVSSELVKWVLDNPDRCPSGVELIVDGNHLSPAFVLHIKNSIGSDKIVLVSDALGPSGLPDGKYKLASLDIYKEGTAFYLSNADHASPKLAGSAASLAHCIKTYWGLTNNADVYSAAVTNPRRSSLSPGAIQSLPDEDNFAIFSEDGTLVMSLCQGKLTEHNALMPKEVKQQVYTPYATVLSSQNNNNSVIKEIKTNAMNKSCVFKL